VIPRSAAPAAPAPEALPCVEKLKSSLRAKLALAGGFVLLELADGSYLVSRWNLSRPCADLRAVAAFAEQVGAR
jgi:hypothetical protein